MANRLRQCKSDMKILGTSPNKRAYPDSSDHEGVIRKLLINHGLIIRLFVLVTLEDLLRTKSIFVTEIESLSWARAKFLKDVITINILRLPEIGFNRLILGWYLSNVLWLPVEIAQICQKSFRPKLCRTLEEDRRGTSFVSFWGIFFRCTNVLGDFCEINGSYYDVPNHHLSLLSLLTPKARTQARQRGRYSACIASSSSSLSLFWE